MVSRVYIAGAFLIVLFISGVLVLQASFGTELTEISGDVAVLKQQQEMLSSQQELLRRRRGEFEMTLASVIAQETAKQEALAAMQAITGAATSVDATPPSETLAQIRSRNQDLLKQAEQQLAAKRVVTRSTGSSLSGSTSTTIATSTPKPRQVTAAS